MRNGRIPAAAPWSFFAPIALAVLLGALVAGLILRGIDAVSGTGQAAAPADPAHAAGGEVPAPRQAEAATRVQEAAPPAASAAAAGPLARTDVDDGSTDGQPASAAPSLPGAIVARRDGAPAACINGTIALRDENGWQQQLENDAPVPCVEASAPAP